MVGVKRGCLNGGNLGHKPQRKSRGIQVFTYKDLEAATDEFSEANVIGNGGYGVVYKGILNDGTVAAIKMLHREGKQRERAFRMEPAITNPRWQVIHKLKLANFVRKIGGKVFLTVDEAVDARWNAKIGIV